MLMTLWFVFDESDVITVYVNARKNNTMYEEDESSSSSSSSSSTASDTSSEDLEFLIENRIIPKNVNYFEEVVLRYDDILFIEHFRVSCHVYDTIWEMSETSRYFHYQTGGNEKMSAKKQIAVFLWFAGHQTGSYRDIADRFNIAISTLHVIVRKVSYFLSNLAQQVIQWSNETEKQAIEQHFAANKFPGVIGAIDGTFINIDKPRDDPDSYLNRKKSFAIQVQLVCDDERRIGDIFLGYLGSVHDSRVLRTSSLFASLAEKCGNPYLLGDSGYACLPNLLTLYKNRGTLNERQNNYNLKLARNRYVIEHCNGILKQKFRQLFFLKLRNIRLICHFIRACAVLHNLALDDDFPYDVDEMLYCADDPMLNNGMDDDEAAADDRDGKWLLEVEYVIQFWKCK